MAAFAALVSLENNLELIQNHPRHSFSFENTQIQSLWESLSFLIYFMKSYDNAHGARKEAAEALERRIAGAAQDVIESHLVDQIRGGKTRSSRFLLDLQKVIEDMDYMRRKAINVQVQSGIKLKAEQPKYSATVTTSTTVTSNKTTMVGFDDVLVQLLDVLTRIPSDRQVIPIVGMGGIGKTTLARNAFEHPYIVQHFDVCLWATVSQQYSVEKLVAKLLSRLRKCTSKNVDEPPCDSDDEVRERLYKSLYGRRYLIILDDMWSIEPWDDIKFLFPETNNGSRIVVTTRHSDVGNQLGISCFAMRFLNEDHSWDLFCQKAFAEQDCPFELKMFGKKIVERCKGLPLAIVVVAGHLRKSSMAVEYWESVVHHLDSMLNSTEIDYCLNVLSLSYSYLPAHLKPCFLLIGAFPGNQKIYASDILKLWIAEGFIQPFENTRLEEVAEYYLCDLSERNLIFVDNLGYKEEIYTFVVHDLVRELCLKIAKKEDFLYVFESPQAINRERRVVIRGKIPEMVNYQRKTLDARIRCLVCQGGRLSYDFKLLRTLNKVVTSSTSESIFQHVNLRCLKVDLDYKTCPTVYLPSSISLLWNLQMLKITAPYQSTVIAPYEIWEMLQLRHLEVNPIGLVEPLPVDRLDQTNDFVLRNLHTLSNVENFRLSQETCKRIPNIRELHLSYCDEACWHYCPHNIGYFHELENLVCEFDGNFSWRDFALSLTFPSSLKRLYLRGCGVDWEELTMLVGSLPHLEILQLYRNSVIGLVWTPVEGEFLHLKTLEISGCDDLLHWNADCSHFPVLQILRLRNLSKLDEFPSGIGEIPTLRWIDLEFCSLSSSFSAMRTLVEQEEMGNEGLQLKVSFKGDEEILESFNNMVRQEGLISNNIFLYLENVGPKSF